MGCCQPKMPEPDARLRATAKHYRLTEAELKKFWILFVKNDLDNTGTMDTQELYHMVQEEPNVFVDSIFPLIETKVENQLDFSEFVTVLCVYNMMSKREVLMFAFNIFDQDKNGFIEREELHALVSILHDNAVDSRTQMSLTEFDSNKDEKISFDEFEQLNRKFPQVLLPAFRVQQRMREFTLGKKYWLNKITHMATEREADAKRQRLAKEREEKTKRAMQMAEVERRMGSCKYFCCFWKRRQYMLDMMRAQRAQDKKMADRDAMAAAVAAVDDGMGGSDYDSSADDGDKYHIDHEYESKKRERRKKLKTQKMQTRVYGFDRPDKDLDRDRRSRLRDVRGTTHKFERVRDDQRYVTQEERAQDHKKRRQRKTDRKMKKSDGSTRRVSPMKYAR